MKAGPAASAALVVLGLRLHGVVDRVEGAWAVVEWEGRSITDVPTAVLPAGVREGDDVVAVLRRRSPARAGDGSEALSLAGFSLVRTISRRRDAGNKRSRRDLRSQ